jgi:hypothetical protein
MLSARELVRGQWLGWAWHKASGRPVTTALRRSVFSCGLMVRSGLSSLCLWWTQTHAADVAESGGEAAGGISQSPAGCMVHTWKTGSGCGELPRVAACCCSVDVCCCAITCEYLVPRVLVVLCFTLPLCCGRLHRASCFHIVLLGPYCNCSHHGRAHGSL